MENTLKDALNYRVVTASENATVASGSLYSCALYRRSHMDYSDIIIDADGYIVPRNEWVNEINLGNAFLASL